MLIYFSVWKVRKLGLVTKHVYKGRLNIGASPYYWTHKNL